MTPDQMCPRCDRAECPTTAPSPPEIRAAWTRIIDADGRANAEDRAIVSADAKRQNAASADCKANAVDWRALALAQRPVVEAAEASLHHVVAQLRHLYMQMRAGTVRDQGEAARGLLGPQIEKLEKLTAAVDTYRTRKP